MGVRRPAGMAGTRPAGASVMIVMILQPNLSIGQQAGMAGTRPAGRHGRHEASRQA